MYKQTSPYYNTKKKDFYLGLYVDRPVTRQDDDMLIELESKYHHRPDLLAYDMYGNTRYWWVFYRRNMELIKDPIFDFNAGMTLYAPSKEQIGKLA